MALFNFFKKNNSSKSILGFSDLNYNDIVEKSIFINKQNLDENLESVELEYTFDGILLNAFDVVRIKLGRRNGEFLKNDNNEIIFASATFYKKNKSLTMEQMQYVVDYILKVCGVEDDPWSEVDEMRINSGVWRGRILLADGKVFIILDDEFGFKIDIIGLNDFIKKIKIREGR